MAKMKVLKHEIGTLQLDDQDYISITDIANAKEDEARAADVIKNWLRNRGTLEFIGAWEHLYNPNFKVVEFDHFRISAGLHTFVLSPGKWIRSTNAIGLVVKAGRYGGTYAHKDIAFEFASAINPIFKLYLIKEFQRLKEQEFKQLGWDIKRNLTKMNYHIHTDAIKQNLIPQTLTPSQVNFVYANEADILNIVLFGKTAKEWRDQNLDKKGNIRDEADVNQLICLANLESLNAHFIQEKLTQTQRLIKLNHIAIGQMKILVEHNQRKEIGEHSEKE
jgi:hypothetical protein